MKRFTRLIIELDESNRTNDKVDSLRRYFQDAAPEDAAWALYFLLGNKIRRAVTTRLLREWITDVSGFPSWLVEESYDTVGDLAETLALLHPGGNHPEDIPLHVLAETCLLPLPEMEEAKKKALVTQTWSRLSSQQRFVWNKLITGGFRLGVARTLVVRALARHAGIDPAVMMHRVMGSWEPSAAAYENLFKQETRFDQQGTPYPFYLAYPLEDEVSSLGEIRDWQIEWKWDGIRAQLLKRGGEIYLWSRGEDLVTERYPEVVEAAEPLPDGTALDGELLAWKSNRPLPFGEMQRRIGRKTVGKKLLAEVPVYFMAYDALEWEGIDRRNSPLHERRSWLEGVLHGCDNTSHLRLSPCVEARTWSELAALREESRERGVEGVMLKRRDSTYNVGRVKGDWWKWKVDPYTIDAVLVYAQKGHGRRASLYTDYTFAVWNNDELVPIAKAYSGLSDREIQEVNSFIQQNTLDRFGPVRVVKPELVFELAFEGIQRSSRHKSGLAVRFPRMANWRKDKPAREADTLEQVKALIPEAPS